MGYGSGQLALGLRALAEQTVDAVERVSEQDAAGERPNRLGGRGSTKVVLVAAHGRCGGRVRQQRSAARAHPWPRNASPRCVESSTSTGREGEGQIGQGRKMSLLPELGSQGASLVTQLRDTHS